jgi:hypothetical protein
MKSLIPIALSLLAGSAVCSSADEPVDLAVVVNKTTIPENVELTELRQMILGEKLKWRNDGQVVITVQTPPDSAERAIAMKTVYHMNDSALRRYYMLAVFNGKEVSQPRDVNSAAALKKFVATNPGAIGCILASEVDNTVKVLKVDGSSPGEPGYKLR